METLRACILVGVLSLAIHFQSIDAQNEKCLADLKIAEETMMNLNECLKEVGADDWKTLDTSKLPCFGKCVLLKRNLVDEAGAPHKENIMSAINSTMTDSMRGDMNLLVEGCLNEHGTKVDPKEEACATYTPLITCISTSFTEVCKKQ